MLLLPTTFLFSAAVFGVAWLKETPIFWLNAGGYPLWLRELVLEGFYPSVSLLLVLLTLLTVSFLTRPSVGWCRLFELAITSSAWTVLLASGAVVVTNNVANLLEGRELHAHPTETQFATAPLLRRL